MKTYRLAGLLLAAVMLVSCTVGTPQSPTPQDQTSGKAASPQPVITSTATPAATPTPEPTLTPTIPLQEVDATVWTQEPVVPVLMYHRFLPDRYESSTNTKTRLSDFREHLQMLYDQGFSLISLEDWLKGNLQVPEGKRPLILTMDDLYFADQLFINPDGQPSLKSGIGVLWQFSQEHPDFGFSIALFCNFGDKYYGNQDVGDRFWLGPNWEESLSQVIVWGIEHGAMPYNQIYTHPRLDMTDAEGVKWELAENDRVLRKYLEMAGRPDLTSKLENLVSLPYSIWPTSDGARKVLLDYKNPEDKPILAIVEADYYDRANYLLAPFNPKFDRNHIPRMAGFKSNIKEITKSLDQFPAAVTCALTLPASDNKFTKDQLAKQVQIVVQQKKCPSGIYSVQGYLFQADSTTISEINIDLPAR
jgi:hypothetical protein